MYVNCRCFISSWEFELHWNKISLQLTAFGMVLILLGNTLDWSCIRVAVLQIIENEFDELYDILSIFYRDMVYDSTN